MDLFNSARSRSASRSTQQTDAIKAQVTAELGLLESSTVMVTELTCEEEDCPDVETVIAVFRPPLSTLRIKLPLPISGVTTRDIEAACRSQHT